MMQDEPPNAQHRRPPRRPGSDAGFQDAGERRALIAEVAFQKREAELRLSELEDARGDLARYDGSVAWKVFQRVSGKLYALLGGRDAPVGRLFGRVLRRAGRSGSRVTAQRRWRELRMPAFPAPDVSIVIPVHSQPELTERCLRAIAAAGDAVAFEVIVVDDDADPDSKRLIEAVEGVRVVVNERNQGYLRATNRGAAEARGRHLVLLNNDTEPWPGWLEALVGRAESAPDVGIVAAKLVYPNGDLQEAGGIVWRDGGAANFGNRQSPDAPEYNHVRAVDYGSAAALLVRRELWESLGGFDERFAPGYYEDVDLCFAARDAGWRVLYEPRAVVTHVEGSSMGIDVGAGAKRHQQLNRPKFTAKWAGALERQMTDGGLEHAHRASDRNRGPHVLIVDHRVPMPDHDAGSLRMFHIVRQLAGMGCRVTFMPDAGAADDRYRLVLQGLGVEVLDYDSNVAAYLEAAGGRTRLAILSRPYVASRYLHVLREHAPAARVAYDTVDLHYVRERRRAQVNGSRDLAKSAGLRELELALARACDVTLVVSAEERRQLLEEEPELAIEILPLANEVWADVPPWPGRSGVLFVGGFEHHPNVDAALELAGKVMPLVWDEIGDVSLTVVGSNPPSAVRALESERVDVRGWVGDLGPLLAGSVAMAAPLRYGAGVKGKVTESLSAGLPVVTTALGAEGLDVEHGRDILIGEDPAALARQIVALHRDAGLWSRLSGNGREVVARTCSPAAQRPVLERLVGLAAGVPGGSSVS
jgi:O-antigen biosynthesis protein